MSRDSLYIEYKDAVRDKASFPPTSPMYKKLADRIAEIKKELGGQGLEGAILPNQKKKYKGKNALFKDQMFNQRRSNRF